MSCRTVRNTVSTPTTKIISNMNRVVLQATHFNMPKWQPNHACSVEYITCYFIISVVVAVHFSSNCLRHFITLHFYCVIRTQWKSTSRHIRMHWTLLLVVFVVDKFRGNVRCFRVSCHSLQIYCNNNNNNCKTYYFLHSIFAASFTWISVYLIKSYFYLYLFIRCAHEVRILHFRRRCHLSSTFGSACMCQGVDQ